MTRMEMLRALLGGGMIGLSAAALLVSNGRIAGVSGILGGLVPPRRGDATWRFLFVTGMVVGGVMLRFVQGDPFHGLATTPTAMLIVAGLLVGVGTSLGSGCTSGHGVCGVSRGSRRSIAATLTFMLAGGVTVFVVRHVIGAVP